MDISPHFLRLHYYTSAGCRRRRRAAELKITKSKLQLSVHMRDVYVLARAAMVKIAGIQKADRYFIFFLQNIKYLAVGSYVRAITGFCVSVVGIKQHCKHGVANC